MNNRKIIFLCDASIKSGMGHLTRSIAIAQSLKDLGEKNILFLVEKNTAATKYFNNLKFIYFSLLKTNKETLSFINKIIIDENPKLLFLDTKLDIPKSFFISLKEKSIKIATIDDSHEKRLESDVSFYPPLDSVYNLNWKNYKGNLNIGWEWIPLRSEFCRKREKILIEKPKKKIKDVLITMGGSDPNNITLLVLKNLKKEIFEKFNIYVIIGAANPNKLEIKNYKLKLQNKFHLIENPSCISDLMYRSDFAICTFGITAYELAALGIPSFHICLNKDHLNSSQLFVQNKMAFSLGLYNYLDKKILEQKIFERRKLDLHLTEMRNNCIKIIDVNGSRRIASRLIFKCENNF